MDFTIDSEIRMLRDTVRRFIDTKLIPLEQQVDETGRLDKATQRALTDEARQLGLFAMNMPESAGGGGLDTVQMSIVEEEFGRTMDALIRRTFGQVYPMLMACKGDQIDRYMKPTVSGDKICAMAITEPGAGSDAASITTTAVRRGNRWIINGSKHFISDGDIADYIIVMAVTDPEKRARGGITLFLVDRDTPGFSVNRVQPMMGHRGYGHAELSFEECSIPEENVLGEVGGGFRLIMNTVAGIRLCHIGARSVGLATRILSMCVDYANERRQFGSKIGEFQMVQKMIADSATEIFAARNMVLNAAWELDQGHENRAKISMVKLFASEMAGRVADRGVQIFGGMGFCKEMPLERFYRDTRVLRIFDGTSEIHRMLIARELLKSGIDPVRGVM
jgi:acyl-CoA dehydrogenase